MATTTKEQVFHVEGMHCTTCCTYLEDTLTHSSDLHTVRVDLARRTVTVTGHWDDESAVLAEKLTARIALKGYRLRTDRPDTSSAKREWLVAIPVALTAMLGFLLLQDIGLVNLITADRASYGTAFFIGLIASVSTCLAVVGGLVLSLSSNAAKHHSRYRTQTLFHIGRLGGFFVLGGVTGSVGKLFQFGMLGSAVLSVSVALIMLILGLNLLDLFPSLKSFQLRLPKIFGQHVHRAPTSPHLFTPFLVGISTFFLPCGFTQSMQVYTLTTGDFFTGGVTMLAFALGTFPVLALLSFGAIGLSHTPWRGTFFKTTGMIVVVLALFQLWNTLRLFPLLS